MALIPYADLSRLQDTAKAAFDSLPRKLNIYRMMLNAQTCFPSGWALGHAIRTHQELAPYLRELAIMAVARLEGGIYEWVHHVKLAETAGCTAQQIAAVEALDFENSCFDSRTKAVFCLLRELVSGAKADEKTVSTLIGYFSPREVVEIILTVGFYMMMVRLTETLRVEVDAPAGVTIPAFERVR